MNKNTKHIVLFFTQDISLYAWKDAGLFEREVRPYLSLAKERGWQITFLTYGDHSDLDFAETLAPIEIVPLWKKAPPKGRLMKVLCAPFAMMQHKDSLGSATIYKINQFWGGWNAIFAKWLWGGKTIARQGYEYLQFARAQGKPKYQLLIAHALEWFIYKFADHIVLATEKDAEFARETFPFLQHKDINIQPNWIDLKGFFPAPTRDETEADLVFIGRFNAQKNLPTLISACARSGASLDLYGDGELREELEALIEASGAQVRFMGRIANDEIPALLPRYKAFVMPSLFEGNPKALLEAMACGKAVLACNVPGVCEIIEDGETGLLSDIDDVSLAEGIKKILSDETLRRALGKAARKSVEQIYSLEEFLNNEEARYGE